jgi:addiction module HigA family antidote
MSVSVSQAARKMGISRQGLHKILAEDRAITPEMAVRIGKYCGNGAGLWLRMQAAFDIWEAERALGRTIAKIPTRESTAA